MTPDSQSASGALGQRCSRTHRRWRKPPQWILFAGQVPAGWPWRGKGLGVKGIAGVEEETTREKGGKIARWNEAIEFPKVEDPQARADDAGPRGTPGSVACVKCGGGGDVSSPVSLCSVVFAGGVALARARHLYSAFLLGFTEGTNFLESYCSHKFTCKSGPMRSILESNCPCGVDLGLTQHWRDALVCACIRFCCTRKQNSKISLSEFYFQYQQLLRERGPACVVAARHSGRCLDHSAFRLLGIHCGLSPRAREAASGKFHERITRENS